MNYDEFEKDFSSYAAICLIKKQSPEKFREFEARYLAFLYINLKMSCTDIISVYPTVHKTIKSAVIKTKPSKWRDRLAATRLASGKKRSAWRDPKSGYNNYGKGGTVNSRNAEMRK